MFDVVCKFGGTSLSCFENIKKVKDIVCSGNKRFVIVSAPGKRSREDIKITDTLIKCFDLSKDNKDFKAYWEEKKKRYTEIMSFLNVFDLDLTKDFEILFDEIKKHKNYDFVISRGEYLSAKIIARYFNYEFLDAISFLTFDMQGKIDLKISQQKFSSIIKKDKFYVIPGFYGLNYNGEVKTFSRGGSDVTGAIVAAISKAYTYENWTDVDGFLVANPRICENPELIDCLTYHELRELSYMGANVLHPDCVRFLRENNIILNLRNTFNPTCKGSLIMPDTKNIVHKKLTGIAGQKGFMIFYIEKFDINESLGIIEGIAKTFKKFNIPIEHIPTGIDTISIVVKKEFVTEKIKADLLSQIDICVNPDKLEIINDVALISVVGNIIKTNRNIEKQIFDVIYSTNSKIININKGAGGISIIFGVTESEFDSTVKFLYKSLF